MSMMRTEHVEDASEQDCSVTDWLPSTTLLKEWSSGHALLEVDIEWFILVGPDDEAFDLGRVWAEWKPGRHSEWETISETADCGCLIVHLHAT